MSRFVITLIGDDRVGIVELLAETIHRHGGNWERSELAELGGKFAGIVMFSVDPDDADSLLQAVRESSPGLDIAIHETSDSAGGASTAEVRFTLDLVGNDRPGIVSEITGTLRGHGVTIDRLETAVSEAPMAGGHLFHAKAELRGPAAETQPLQADLEQLAAELMVEIRIGGTDA